jgi:hypothetical protein
MRANPDDGIGRRVAVADAVGDQLDDERVWPFAGSRRIRVD